MMSGGGGAKATYISKVIARRKSRSFKSASPSENESRFQKDYCLGLERTH
jgi:hypothetical protein